MKKLLTLLFFLAFSGMLFAQTYPLVTVEDIQYLPDSVLINEGDQPSPLNGDTWGYRVLLWLDLLWMQQQIEEEYLQPEVDG